MVAELQEHPDSFDPERLRELGDAFDEVWRDIAGKFQGCSAQEKRNELALVIFELARNGEADPDEIKYIALTIMRQRERPGSQSWAMRQPAK